MIKKSEVAGVHLKADRLRLGRWLADDYELYTKMRNAHSKFHGPKLVEPHKLLENQDDAAHMTIENEAERARGAAHPLGMNKRSNLSAEEKHQQGTIRTRRRGGKG